jgi:hypothetical protein
MWSFLAVIDLVRVFFESLLLILLAVFSDLLGKVIESRIGSSRWTKITQKSCVDLRSIEKTSGRFS